MPTVSQNDMSEVSCKNSNEPPHEKVRSNVTQVGVVVSNKMTKTIVVESKRRIPHPKFKKIVNKTTKLYAHDEKSLAKVGDTVVIAMTRPLSKMKRWVLLEVK